MAKRRLMVTFFWMIAGFFGAALISFVLAPLLPRQTDKTSVGVMSLVYIGFALLPLVGVFAPLALGLAGKLPGTKSGGPSRN